MKPLRALADRDGYIKTGMIPKGTPVNLVANLDPDFQHIDVLAKIAEKLGIATLKKPDFTRNPLRICHATEIKERATTAVRSSWRRALPF